MRFLLLSTLTVLAACSGSATTRFASHGADLNVGDAALAAGAPTVALNVANGLLRQNPGNVDARILAGEAHYRLGDLAAASSDYRDVLALHPGSLTAQLGMGRVELSIDPAAAQRRFQQVAAKAPRNAAALTDLGISYDLQGQHAAAQRMYRVALDLMPDLASAQNNLALSLTLGKEPTSMVAAQTAPSAGGTTPAVHNAGL